MKYSVVVIALIVCLMFFSMIVLNAFPENPVSSGQGGTDKNKEPDLTYSINPSVKQDDTVYNNQTAYFLYVEGKTNLPDKSVIDVTFSYLFPGNENERYLDFKRCQIKSGAYQIRLGPYKQNPTAGQYLFKVVFEPSRQPEEVSRYISDKYGDMQKISKIQILIIGTSSENAHQERERMLKTIRKQGIVLKGLLTEIKEQFPKSVDMQGKSISDTQAAQKLHKETIDKLDAMLKVVLAEDELRVFDMVTQYKSLIESSIFLLKSLIQKVDEILTIQAQIINQSGQIKEELDQKFALIYASASKLYEMTAKEVGQNIIELGIISFNKDIVLATLQKIENTINGISPDGMSGLKEAEKSLITEQVLLLSRELPETFYDRLHQLAFNLTNLTRNSEPVNKQSREEIIYEINGLRNELKGY
ncbi:MAG: hypothetical protein V1871_00810 [Planctomycetota bacterium]